MQLLCACLTPLLYPCARRRVDIRRHARLLATPSGGRLRICYRDFFVPFRIDIVEDIVRYLNPAVRDDR